MVGPWRPRGLGARTFGFDCTQVSVRNSKNSPSYGTSRNISKYMDFTMYFGKMNRRNGCFSKPPNWTHRPTGRRRSTPPSLPTPTPTPTHTRNGGGGYTGAPVLVAGARKANLPQVGTHPQPCPPPVAPGGARAKTHAGVRLEKRPPDPMWQTNFKLMPLRQY